MPAKKDINKILDKSFWVVIISIIFDMFVMAIPQNKVILSSLKALGNPIRLDILKCLISGEQCVCVLFEKLKLPQNLVSHHLGILRKNEFIKARKEGKWVHYSLNPVQFGRLGNFMGKFSIVKKKKSKC